jgi:hypothetical protein
MNIMINDYPDIKINTNYSIGDFEIIKNVPEAACEGGAKGHVIIFKT